MKRKYMKPRVRQILSATEHQLLAASASAEPTFNVTTSLSSLGGFGGGRGANFGD